MEAVMEKRKAKPKKGEGRKAKGEKPAWDPPRFGDASDDVFEHESFGIIPAAEMWLQAHAVPDREIDAYMALLAERRGKTFTSTLGTWRDRVEALFQRFTDAGWTRIDPQIDPETQWQLERIIEDVPVGLSLTDNGLAAYAARPNDPAFFSETGYRSFVEMDGAKMQDPMKVYAFLLRQLREHRNDPAKRRENRKAKPAGRAGKSAASRSTRPSTSTALVPSPAARKPTAVAVVEATSVPAGPLTAPEKKLLKSQEAIIARNKKAFIEVGQALFTIRDRYLWRGEFTSFAAYCQAKHGWDNKEASDKITAAQRYETAAPIAKRLGIDLANEGQVRALAGLDDPADLRAALSEAARVAKREGRAPVSRDLTAAKRHQLSPPEDLQRRREKGEGRREKGDEPRPGLLRMPQILEDPRPFREALGIGPDAPTAWVVPADGEAAAGLWNGQQVRYAPVLGSVRRSLEKLAERYEGNSAAVDNLAHLLFSLANEFWLGLGITKYAVLQPAGGETGSEAADSDLIHALAGSAAKGARRPK